MNRMNCQPEIADRRVVVLEPNLPALDPWRVGIEEGLNQGIHCVHLDILAVIRESEKIE